MAGEKVLIVEDELHALMGLAELVSGWGYRTETARDGAEALDKVMAWQPGIIVTDMKMPRMDGIELLNRLGELPDKQCVILLTAQGSIDRAVEAMKLGAYDFIQKPVDPTRLKMIPPTLRVSARPNWSSTSLAAGCEKEVCSDHSSAPPGRCRTSSPSSSV
jgi:DNA-binding NtrC family response regulator